MWVIKTYVNFVFGNAKIFYRGKYPYDLHPINGKVSQPKTLERVYKHYCT